MKVPLPAVLCLYVCLSPLPVLAQSAAVSNTADTSFGGSDVAVIMVRDSASGGFDYRVLATNNSE